MPSTTASKPCAPPNCRNPFMSEISASSAVGPGIRRRAIEQYQLLPDTVSTWVGVIMRGVIILMLYPDNRARVGEERSGEISEKKR